MDKNIYETYEFLPSNSETEQDQFFVVQNDGTLLINRQVQYITQVEDVKEVLENVQPCTVYDVASQQYFVDVNNSTTELISVTDQFALPQDESNNVVYGNNYLLQSMPDTSTIQISEHNVPNEMDQANTEMVVGDENGTAVQVPENTNLTAITLSDEQYQTLEEKGWLLLDINDKIFLLNALGLHDITDDEKLIQQLKNNDKMQEDAAIKPEVKYNETSESEEIKIEITPERDQSEIADVTIDTKSDTKLVPTDCLANALFTANNDIAEPNLNANIPKSPVSFRDKLQQVISKDLKRNCTVVRLKTNFHLKDIPKKIVLGKTKNGKNLVAKVTHVKKVLQTNCRSNEEMNNDDGNGPQAEPAKQNINETYNIPSEVEKLIQQSLVSEVNCTTEDITSAETITKQLLNVPTTRAPMIDRNIIITKIVKELDESENIISECLPTLVTGRVKRIEQTRKALQKEDKNQFSHIPNLLKKLSCGIQIAEESESVHGDSHLKTGKPRDDYLLHVHVVVMKSSHAPTKTSISFFKRRPPKKSETWACSGCAMLFYTSRELKEHQEARCLDGEDDKPPLIIDTEKINKQNPNKNIVLKGLKTTSCSYCNVKIKLSNYKRHLLSHFGPSSNNSAKGKEKDVEENTKNKSTYKCKMCASSYVYASSLSKHIMSQHIKSRLVQQ